VVLLISGKLVERAKGKENLENRFSLREEKCAVPTDACVTLLHWALQRPLLQD
jgi:hypothetical protein